MGICYILFSIKEDIMKKKAPPKKRALLRSDLSSIEEAKFNRFTDFLLRTLVKRKTKNKGIYGSVEGYYIISITMFRLLLGRLLSFMPFPYASFMMMPPPPPRLSSSMRGLIFFFVPLLPIL